MMAKSLLNQLRATPLEIFAWATGLLALSLANPDAEGLLDLCLFKHLGFDGCPGCGLGHSIAYLLHGQLGQAFETHPLGPFAVVVLCARIITLLSEPLRSRVPESLS